MSKEKFTEEVNMMLLDKLTEMREGISNAEFPISENELLKRYEQIYTGAVNDVLLQFCLLDQALPNRIIPLREYRSVAGIAFTVKSAANMRVQEEIECRSQVLDEMHENAFVVWDTSEDKKATNWGGIMTATAKMKKVKAACIDGGIRDTHQILEAGFPVFYKYRISNSSIGRSVITHYQKPIQIENVVIKPGDVVLGDVDGVVIVPRELAYKVLLQAEEVVKTEKNIFDSVEAGKSVKEINDKEKTF